jgi:hypothetical protein
VGRAGGRKKWWGERRGLRAHVLAVVAVWGRMLEMWVPCPPAFGRLPARSWLPATACG